MGGGGGVCVGGWWWWWWGGGGGVWGGRARRRDSVVVFGGARRRVCVGGGRAGVHEHERAARGCVGKGVKEHAGGGRLAGWLEWGQHARVGPARGGGSTSGSGSVVATLHTPCTTTSGGAGPGSHHRARTRWQPGQAWRGSRRRRRRRPAQHNTVASQVQEGKEGIRFQQDAARRKGGGGGGGGVPWGAAADAQKMPAEQGRQHFPRGRPGAARRKDGAHGHMGLLTMCRRLPCPTHQHRLQQDAEALVLVGDHCGKERATRAGSSGTAGGRARRGAQRGASGASRRKRASLSWALRFPGSAGARGLPHTRWKIFGANAAQKYVPAISLQCNSPNAATLSAAGLGGLRASTASRGVAGTHSASARESKSGELTGSVLTYNTLKPGSRLFQRLAWPRRIKNWSAGGRYGHMPHSLPLPLPSVRYLT